MRIKNVFALLLSVVLLVSSSYGIAVTLATEAETSVAFLRNRSLLEQLSFTLGLLGVTGGVVALLASCLCFGETSDRWKKK